MTMNEMNEKEFERLLKTTLTPGATAERGDRDAADRVLKRLAGPLPRQKTAWWRLPAVLLDWQFATAWPRIAVLATCAALGFGIGLIGLDQQVDTADAALAFVSRADFSGVVFDGDTTQGAH
jgi:hypothetical protein